MVIQMRTCSVRIIAILLVSVFLCGVAGAVAVGVIAETRETSGAVAPACPAACECMSETAAIAKWGTTGYESCSKTICGQTADAMVQYYCFHAIGGAAPAATNPPAQAAAPAATAPAAAAPAAPAAPAAAATQKSPVNAATVLASIGATLVSASALRRK